MKYLFAVFFACILALAYQAGYQAKEAELKQQRLRILKLQAEQELTAPAARFAGQVF